MSKIWDFLKALGRRLFQIVLQYPLATALTVLIVVGAVFMTAFGKTIQIGGLLGKLWGKEPAKTDARLLPPSDRVDKDGKPIPVGESDDKGFTQAVETKIKDPGIFDNPSTITVVHPDKGEVVLPLPEGVKNTDVQQVIEIQPNVYQVQNNDKGVNPKDALEALGEK